MIGGKSLDVTTEIDSELFFCTPDDASAHIGFELMFPFDQSNEDRGFGVCHKCKLTASLHSLRRVLRPKLTMSF